MGTPNGIGVRGHATIPGFPRGRMGSKMPGAMLVWNAWGHDFLAEEALKQALKDLPDSVKWVRYFLKDTSTGAVYRDMTDVFSGGHWSRSGQKHHFMRHTTQTEFEAYQQGVKWIRENAHKAAKNLRRVWVEKTKNNRPRFGPIFVNEPLGDAYHALQDSFSPAHVTRKKHEHRSMIIKVHAYDENNKTPDGDWPGHKELDKQWKGPMGKEAIVACRELVKIVLASSFQKRWNTFHEKWDSLWQTFEHYFLSTTIEKTIKI